MDETLEKDRINEIIETIMKVARGDYSTYVEFSGKNDEVDSLAVGLNMMIDDIRTSTEALRESEERYREVVETSIDMIATVAPNGDFLLMNKAWKECFGYSGDKIKVFDVIHPEDLEAVRERFIQVLEGQSVETLEFRSKTKEGSYINLLINISPIFDSQRNVVTTLGIAKDITKRKRMEYDLRERVKELQCLYGIAYIAERPGITLDELCQEVVNLLPASWQYPEITCAKITLGDREFKTDDFKTTEWKLSTSIKVKEQKEGTIEVYYLEARPEFDEGPFLKEERLLIDAVAERLGRITKRKRMERELKEGNEQLDAQNEELRAIEEELRAANEELQASNEELRAAQEQLIRSEKLAAIGQLAGGVGHELRNPLGAIKNAIYYVRGKVAKSELGQKEPQVIEFLDIMDDEVNSSNKIINDLLGFSRVGKPTVSPTRIERVIEDALSHLTVPENIEVVKKLDAGLPQVNVDTDQTRQVLVNMIMNAVQAMPEGGRLTISAREEDKFLEVEISDSGCGIPQEVMNKIFDPLFTTKAKGIGLGLAVCKTVIDRHQGHIEVESEVGKGTTFTIRLPLKAE